MQTYVIRTDACEAEIEAETIDAAAVEFAAGEKLRGVTDAASLLSVIFAIDGGWCWIEDAEGNRVGSHVAR